MCLVKLGKVKLLLNLFFSCFTFVVQLLSSESLDNNWTTTEQVMYKRLTYS